MCAWPSIMYKDFDIEATLRIGRSDVKYGIWDSFEFWVFSFELFRSNIIPLKLGLNWLCYWLYWVCFGLNWL
jgi:hypothetical protein